MVSTAVEIPLDIFTDYDTNDNRFFLLYLNCVFFLSLVIGVWISSQKLNVKTQKNIFRFSSSFIEKFFYMFILLIIAMEPIFFKFTLFSGGYDNEKPGYFFEYTTVLICIYYAYSKNISVVKRHLPNCLHMFFCILAGERMMMITAVGSLLFSIDRMSFRLKNIILMIAFVAALLFIDKFRSTADIDSGFLSKFLFDGVVTHHGSLLYSSLFIIDFSSTISHNLFDSFGAVLFLLGLDGSTQGLGFADQLEMYGRRGGGGLFTAFAIALFGHPFGIIFIVIIGVTLSRVLSKKNYGLKISPIELIFVSFIIHGMLYTPLLIVKPVICGVITTTFLYLVCKIFKVSHARINTLRDGVHFSSIVHKQAGRKTAAST